MTNILLDKSPSNLAANFSSFRRRAGRVGLISFILTILVSGFAGFALHRFLTSKQIGAEIFLTPESAAIVIGLFVLCLGLLSREILLRHVSERDVHRQINLLSNNVARLTRRIGFDPLTDTGRGEANIDSLVTELRELRRMVLALHGVRGVETAKKPQESSDSSGRHVVRGASILPKTPLDAEWGAEPLGIDTPFNRKPQANNLSSGQAASAKQTYASKSAQNIEPPSFLKASKSDRAVNLSDDNGADLNPKRGLNDISLEPIMSVVNAKDGATDSLRDALSNDRLDIYLEPILSLPHRRLAYSRVSSHIIIENQQSLSPLNYRDLAREAGLLGMIDNLTLVRVVNRIRRLRRAKQILPVLCPISSDTLRERDLFNDFRIFLRSNAELSSHVIFSFAQYDIERVDPRTESDLVELHRFGFRYCLRDVTNFDIFAADYGRRGFKFIDVAATFLIQSFPNIGESNAVKKLLDPGGLDLIANGIEDEENLLDILDYNIDFGSGAVFGLARPTSEFE